MRPPCRVGGVGPSWCHPAFSQPFAFLLGSLVLLCCHTEHPTDGGRGGLLVLFPPALPSCSPDPVPPHGGCPSSPQGSSLPKYLTGA